MYNSDDIPFPFWGAEKTSKMGRDPLGVQNSSVVIYSDMIKGITNVTSRVRYNGFYCWLLTFIAERLFDINRSLVDNPKLQFRYIRRAELLLAYTMVEFYPTVLGVSGSSFAKTHIHMSELNLVEGADVESKEKYWQNRYGIFGQYYMGVLSQLRLIHMPDTNHNTYRVTKEGKCLCEIFRKSIGREGEDIFWNAIYTGIISKDKLYKLKGITLHIIDDEDELQEYEKIFCSYDVKSINGEDVYHRLKTMKMILYYIYNDGAKVNRQDLVLSFLKYNFMQTLNKKIEVSDEELSWFLYELNELTHAAYEAFHFAILYSTSEEPQPLDNVLEILEHEYKTHLVEESNTTDIYELYGRLKGCYNDKKYGALTCEASRLLFALYDAVAIYFPKILDYAQTADYEINHQGFALSLLLRFDCDEMSKCNWEFTENCIYSAINDHLKSSYAKSTIDQGIVHNYMVEEGLIWQLRCPDPIRTSPRLQNVLLYIEDMRWIERTENYYNITERGLNILMK